MSDTSFVRGGVSHAVRTEIDTKPSGHKSQTSDTNYIFINKKSDFKGVLDQISAALEGKGSGAALRSKNGLYVKSSAEDHDLNAPSMFRARPGKFKGARKDLEALIKDNFKNLSCGGSSLAKQMLKPLHAVKTEHHDRIDENVWKSLRSSWDKILTKAGGMEKLGLGGNDQASAKSGDVHEVFLDAHTYHARSKELEAAPAPADKTIGSRRRELQQNHIMMRDVLTDCYKDAFHSEPRDAALQLMEKTGFKSTGLTRESIDKIKDALVKEKVFQSTEEADNDFQKITQAADLRQCLAVNVNPMQARILDVEYSASQANLAGSDPDAQQIKGLVKTMRGLSGQLREMSLNADLMNGDQNKKLHQGLSDSLKTMQEHRNALTARGDDPSAAALAKRLDELSMQTYEVAMFLADDSSALPANLAAPGATGKSGLEAMSQEQELRESLSNDVKPKYQGPGLSMISMANVKPMLSHIKNVEIFAAEAGLTGAEPTTGQILDLAKDVKALSKQLGAMPADTDKVNLDVKQNLYQNLTEGLNTIQKYNEVLREDPTVAALTENLEGLHKLGSEIADALKNDISEQSRKAEIKPLLPSETFPGLPQEIEHKDHVYTNNSSGADGKIESCEERYNDAVSMLSLEWNDVAGTGTKDASAMQTHLRDAFAANYQLQVETAAKDKFSGADHASPTLHEHRENQQALRVLLHASGIPARASVNERADA